MSKRFGRNQKRKMRKAIEAAQAERETYRQWYEQAREIGRRNRQIVEDTADILGQHFMTMDPGSVEVRTLDAIIPDWQVPMRARLDSPWNSDASFNAPVAMERAFLPILRGSSVADELYCRQHYRFTYRGRQVGYAVDEKAMRSAPKDYLVQQMAREMARILVSEIRNGA